VLDFILELALRGWPLNKQRTREHVNKICQARLGDEFPEDGVGECWVDRFLNRYQDLIRMYRAHPLESICHRARFSDFLSLMSLHLLDSFTSNPPHSLLSFTLQNKTPRSYSTTRGDWDAQDEYLQGYQPCTPSLPRDARLLGTQHRKTI